MFTSHPVDLPGNHAATSSDDVNSFNFGTFLSPMMAAAGGATLSSHHYHHPVGSTAPLSTDMSPLLDPALDEFNLDAVAGHLSLDTQLEASRASSPGFAGSSSYTPTTPRFPAATVGRPVPAPSAKSLGKAHLLATSCPTGGLASSSSSSRTKATDISPSGDAMDSTDSTPTDVAAILQSLRRSQGDHPTMDDAKLISLMQQLPALEVLPHLITGYNAG
ncbi:hypothetical protein IWQ60_000624 [Tieghemiomyces parasiticus]|uniref:Uncharacterized protein n=1 Tax=Tieghemiomyces parasiticus TaxID=78921 RepID=A0A9W8AI62_9FUNG|nr:hypothetical protein IWQ60_000624 [Tieghemiomyces parasiticus]